MKSTRIVTVTSALALSVLAFPALAVDTKLMPDSAYQATFASGLQALFRGNGTILSSGSERVFVTCPVVKDASRIKSAEVRVIDRNPGPNPEDNISCTLATLRNDGSVQQSQTAKSSSSFDVALPLTFGGQGATSTGSYNLQCELPAFVASRGPSAIVMYSVVED
jgi:hypothetical protein